MKSEQTKTNNNLVIFSVVLLIYLFLSLVITYPLVFSFGDKIILGGGDVYQVLGKINDQVSIIEENGFIQSIPILIKNQAIGIITAYALLKMAIGLFPAYNVFLIESIVLAGFGAYLLALHFTKSHKASFLAGLIYSFAPFHLLHSATGHLGSSHIEWIPFFSFFLFRYLEKYKVSDLLYFFIFIFLTALTEHHYFAFSGFFILLVLGYKSLFEQDNKKRKKLLTVLLAFLIFYLLLAAFFYHGYLSQSLGKSDSLSVDIDQARRYSMPLIDPLMPPSSSSLWPWAHEKFTLEFEKITSIKSTGIGESGSSGFLGFTTLILSAYLLFILVKKRKSGSFDKKTMRDITFWYVSGIVFYFFSLGPIIEILGKNHNLPYRLIFEYVPFMDSVRVCDRWFIFSIMSVSVISAYGFKYLTSDKRNALRWVLFLVISSALIIEFLLVPFKINAAEYSNWYDRISHEPGEFRILEIPSSTNYDYGSYQRYICSIHKKECVGGIVTTGRKKINQYNFEENTPIVRKLLYELPKNINEARDIVTQNYDTLGKSISNFHNIRYIIVSNKYLSTSRLDIIKKYIEVNISSTPIYSDEFIEVYRIETENTAGGIYVNRIVNENQKNWEKAQTQTDGVVSRKLNRGSAFEVVNMFGNPKKVILRWNEISKYPLSARLNTDFGDEFSFKASQNWTTHEWQLVFPPGINKITFSYDDPGEHAISVSDVSIMDTN